MTFDELVVALKTQQDMASSLKVTIDKLKRQILETKEAQDGIAPIRNEGGQRKMDNLTLEIKRTHRWDQDALHTFYYQQADDTLLLSSPEAPSTKSINESISLGPRSNPAENLKIGSALSVELGKPSIKSVHIKEEK